MQTANGLPPCSLEQEVAGIIGYGTIGKRLDVLCKALGMEVLIAERKEAGTPSPKTSNETNGPAAVSRTPFEEVIRSATALFICCTPRDVVAQHDRRARAKRHAACGGVVNTAAVRALRETCISGAAVDVSDREPACAEDDSAFLAADAAGLNLTPAVAMHVGYCSTKTVLAMEAMAKKHIKNVIPGDYRNFEA
ncbi:uncharacterized protein F4812DRAFT_468625 [Daldinia caldariorum]|uniref:uncharacterized protein n=1 Tax=Daldinia caldariorum TaxID=326644 RepID=UPI00200769DC|nr:uncharacterized protein F4812DRAFT_468625 [Daldinia caldariorum]KAI1463529.1 hypothetical protein F4812DRAFT_468625 [Daldinia caldariorum]